MMLFKSKRQSANGAAAIPREAASGGGRRFGPDLLDRLYKERISFEHAKARHRELVEEAEAQVRKMGGTGIKWMPMCRSACEPGEISDYLLDICLDPFLKWNILYFAPDAKTAYIFDTLIYNPSYEGLCDDALCAQILKSKALWERAKAEYEAKQDRAELLNVRDYIRVALNEMTVDVEREIFAGRQNHLQHFFVYHTDRSDSSGARR